MVWFLGLGFFFLFVCVCLLVFGFVFFLRGEDRGEGVGRVLEFPVFWGFFPLFKEI